jgi:hypothetical protein
MDGEAELAGKEFSSLSTRSTARRLRLSRQRLGSYRHDLLVAMRLVNSLERDMVHAEWDNWLFEETSRCRQAQSILSTSRTPREVTVENNKTTDGGSGNERDEATGLLSDYCASCSRERKESDTRRHLGLTFP